MNSALQISSAQSKVTARQIPNEIVEAAKQGFSWLDASWFRDESIDFVKRSLLNADAAIFSVLDRSAVAPLIEEHLRGERNRRLLIWSLLNVESWMSQQ
jgi:asparagine synthase (glutamine-hydrolysing)